MQSYGKFLCLLDVLVKFSRTSELPGSCTAFSTHFLRQPARLSTILFPSQAILSAVEYIFTLQYLGGLVGGARKKYAVEYPNLYAAPGKTTSSREITQEEANRFNCVQRGHQQALEGDASFLALHFLAALYNPYYAAIGRAVNVIAENPDLP